MIGVTYGFARSTLLARENTAARDQTIIHADLIRQQLEENPQTINVFVDRELRFRIDDDGFANLGSLDASRPRAGTDTQRRIDDYPEVIVSAVEQRGNGTAYVGIDGQNYVAVGGYIGAFDVGYYEAVPLGGTDRPLRACFTALSRGGRRAPASPKPPPTPLGKQTPNLDFRHCCAGSVRTSRTFGGRVETRACLCKMRDGGGGSLAAPPPWVMVVVLV